MMAQMTATAMGTAAAMTRRAAMIVMAPLKSSHAAVVKMPRDEMWLLV
jgi:hypothetical protein